MLDFTEQAPSTESPPESSADTQTESDSHPATKENPTFGFPDLMETLGDPETTAATVAKLAPYRQALETEEFFQDESEPEEA